MYNGGSLKSNLKIWNKANNPAIEEEHEMMDIIEYLIWNPRFLKFDKFY